MVILSFTGKELAKQETSAYLFWFQHQSYNECLHNIWIYDGMYAHLSD